MIGFLASYWYWLPIAIIALALAFAPAVLAKFWRELAIVAAIIVAVIFWRDAEIARDALRQRDLDDAVSFANAQSSARSTEQTATEALAAATTAHERERNDAQDTLDGLRTDRDTGALQLHARFQCPPPAGVPDRTAGASSGDGEAGAQLSRADEDFLVREAARADEVTRELSLAQETIRIYQRTCGAGG